MTKDILIEVFKNKAVDNEARPVQYGNGAFTFWMKEDNTILGEYVDIRIIQKNSKYFINYERVSCEITKNEYDELLLIYEIKKSEYDKIEAEKEQISYNRDVKNLLEIYKESVTGLRTVLIEKYA